jgi:hypothetical protein
MLVSLRKVLAAILLVWCSAFPPSQTRAQEAPGVRKVFRKAVPNLHAPELFSRDLRMKIMLVNMPGAGVGGSTWELSYQLYFIPESAFRKATVGRPQGAWNPTPQDFPGRILLGEGRFGKSGLGTLRDRTYVSAPIPFKEKIADKARTKFSSLMVSYSLKIEDARLRTTIYDAKVFLTEPFEERAGRDVPRAVFPLNFYVTPRGKLYPSILPRETDSTEW